MRLWTAVANVADPELPMLTIADLGILRDVQVDEQGTVQVTITPTYSGCPAMEAIRADVEDAVRGRGYTDVAVRTVLSPPWSTDWITAEGKRKLHHHGIAPPSAAAPEREGRTFVSLPVLEPPRPACPRCGSSETSETSRFGVTACTALWACRHCGEPFEHVKPL